MTVVRVAMTMAMTMRGGFGRHARRAVMLVIPVFVIVRMRMHGRYRSFYARSASFAKRGGLLSGYLDT